MTGRGAAGRLGRGDERLQHLESARRSCRARTWVRAAACLCALAGQAGCALEQKMSMEIIDAPLRTRGVELRAADAPRGELRLGDYRVRTLARARSSEGVALLPQALPRPASFERLEFEVVPPQGPGWRGVCQSQRRQARTPELAGELDEIHDELGLACDLQDGAGAGWRIEASGDVGRGLAGELRAADGRLVFSVEVTTRRTFVRYVERELPIAVAQLRRGRAAAAAMLLAAPERAWLAPKLPADERDLAVVAMVALRLIPVDRGGV